MTGSDELSDYFFRSDSHSLCADMLVHAVKHTSAMRRLPPAVYIYSAHSGQVLIFVNRNVIMYHHIASPRGYYHLIVSTLKWIFKSDLAFSVHTQLREPTMI